MPDSSIPDLLAEAREGIRLPIELDVCARLAAANLEFGLARLLAALRTIDPDGRITYLASPDFTITRTVSRWQAGFSYGGLTRVESRAMDGDEALVFPELRPNACGTLVGRLRQPRTVEDIIRAAARARAESEAPVWDYSRRNHFINLYRRRLPDGSLGDWIFIIHGCPARIRRDTRDGPGIDPKNSEHWQARSETIPTPLGEVAVLRGPDARDFRANFQRCERLSLDDRLRVAQDIFGDFETLQNVSHVGMTELSTYYHGCHPVGRPGELFPVMTRPDAPAFLVEKGKADAILPHGTGYRLDLPTAFETIIDPARQRPIFVFDQGAGADGGNGSDPYVANGRGRQVYSDFTSVPFAYRGPERVARWQEQGYLRIGDTLLLEAMIKL